MKIILNMFFIIHIRSIARSTEIEDMGKPCALDEERIATPAEVEKLAGIDLSSEISDYSRLTASRVSDLATWKSEDCPQQASQISANALKKKKRAR